MGDITKAPTKVVTFVSNQTFAAVLLVVVVMAVTVRLSNRDGRFQDFLAKIPGVKQLAGL